MITIIYCPPEQKVTRDEGQFRLFLSFFRLYFVSEARRGRVK
jgi:hypothetical protein